MSRVRVIRHEFVEFVPKELEEGVLYVSVPYSTTVHKCACGCGSKIALPLSPTKWRLMWDGETVSLWPSIGNWSYPCRSHYWIEQGRIEWAPAWTHDEIQANRAIDKARHDGYLKAGSESVTTEAVSPRSGRGLFDRLRGALRRW